MQFAQNVNISRRLRIEFLSQILQRFICYFPIEIACLQTRLQTDTQTKPSTESAATPPVWMCVGLLLLQWFDLLFMWTWSWSGDLKLDLHIGLVKSRNRTHRHDWWPCYIIWILSRLYLDIRTHQSLEHQGCHKLKPNITNRQTDATERITMPHSRVVTTMVTARKDATHKQHNYYTDGIIANVISSARYRKTLE